MTKQSHQRKNARKKWPAVLCKMPTRYFLGSHCPGCSTAFSAIEHTRHSETLFISSVVLRDIQIFFPVNEILKYTVSRSGEKTLKFQRTRSVIPYPS